MIKPLLKRVLIEVRAKEKKTSQGIILPENTKNDSMREYGTIVALGKKVEGLEVGDQVIFTKEWGSEMIEDGKTMTLVESDNVLAIIE